MIGFGDVLDSAIEAFGPLCVGIDPHPFLLADWGLEDSAEGAREFGLRVVDAAAGQVGIVKPQVAFFERHGSQGYAALEKVLGAARAAGLTVIADAKRGDIGSTVEAYGEAWLTPGSPLEADAMTIYAYQGVGSIAGMMRRAVENGKGLFVVAATSNPDARELQTAVLAGSGATVARAIIDGVTAFNVGSESARAAGSFAPVGSIGVVIGATLTPSDYGIDVSTGYSPGLPVLAPGFGEQGAKVSGLRDIYGALSPFTIVNEARGLLAAGPRGIAAAIGERAAEVRAALG